MSLVIDTNVAVVANNMNENASIECIKKCQNELLEAQNGIVLIDDNDNQHILTEYRKRLSHSGQPGLGDAFFKWLFTNQENTSLCRKVKITDSDPAGLVFEEFPNDPNLNDFDRSDRKFVAVAIASGETPDILNACDTDWWEFQNELLAHGVRVRFLCEELMT